MRFLIIFSFFDLLFTSIGLTYYPGLFIELNPVMDWVFNNYGVLGLVLTKIIGLVTVWTCLEIARPSYPSLVEWTYFLGNILTCVAALSGLLSLYLIWSI